MGPFALQIQESLPASHDGNADGSGSSCGDGVGVSDDGDLCGTGGWMGFSALESFAISLNSFSDNAPILNTLRNVSSSNDWNTSIRSTGGLCASYRGVYLGISSR
jgi:hypothetical protein